MGNQEWEDENLNRGNPLGDEADDLESSEDELDLEEEAGVDDFFFDTESSARGRYDHSKRSDWPRPHSRVGITHCRVFFSSEFAHTDARVGWAPCLRAPMPR